MLWFDEKLYLIIINKSYPDKFYTTAATIYHDVNLIL